MDGTIRNDAPNLRWYLGYPLKEKEGSRVGVLCAWGTQPRVFTSNELKMFEDAAFWVQRELLSNIELDRASEIQRSLLPENNVVISGYEIAGFCQPHFSVGGDFYDWIHTPDGAAFTLGDVMGKGIGSALMAATVRSAFRTASWQHKVDEVMSIAAQVLEPDLDRAGAFVTLIHGQLNQLTNEIRYIDAGHGLTMHVSSAGKVTRLVANNYPIGIGQIEDWVIQEIHMERGDTLIMISDGFLDVFDGAFDRLKVITDIALRAKSAQEIVDELQRIIHHSITPDDVTALVLRRN